MTFEEGVKSRKTEALRRSRMKMKRYSRRTKPTIKRVGNTREPSIFELEEKDIEKIEITPDREVETPEMAIAKLLQVPGLSFELQTGNGSVPIPLANIRKSSFDGVISRMVLNTSTGSSKDFLRKGSYTEMNESSVRFILFL
jgi:hypothetical protein